jgi:MFS family permease
MVFAAAAVGAGLVRTVATTYLPVLLSAVKDAPGLIGLAMVVNALAGFAVPLVVGLWSDRRHTVRHGRRPFLLGGAILTACGLGAIAFGYQTSFLMLTLAGFVTYVGVNIVTTTHRTLVHDCFEDGSHARGNGAQEVAALTGALVGLVGGGMLSEVAAWAPFALAAIAMPVLVWPTFRRIPVATHITGR